MRWIQSQSKIFTIQVMKESRGILSPGVDGSAWSTSPFDRFTPGKENGTL